jgi:acetyltransferase-like isoleucine patch superfamily enzyme
LAGDNVKRGFLARIRNELRPIACELSRQFYVRGWGMDIGKDCRISLSARLDRTYPRGIHIGESTAVSFGAVILSHDYTRGMHVDTRIGKRCQIGAHSFVMPGVTIGDECIVAPASVVMKDVPSNTIVAGNPARAIERDIRTGRWGKLIREEL